MIISQHLHPISNSQEFIPVTICTYNGESKFVRVCEHYGDFLEIVKSAFCIWSNPKLQIQTSSLNICQGRSIVVDDSAYPYLWKALDEVTVTIVGYEVKPMLLEPDVIPPVAVPLPAQEMPEYAAPSRPLVSVVEVPREVEPEPEPAESRLPTPPAAPSVPVKGRGRSKKVVEEKKPVEPTEEIEMLVKKEKASAKKPAKEGASTTRKRGPAKGKAGIASTSAPVEEDVIEEPALPAPAPDHDPEETTGTNTPPAKSEPELEDNSKRVEVTIIGPDGELIKFKARPKHAIKKILVAACKNYEVEWEMASLDLVHEDEEGNMSPPIYHCQPEDLIGSLGIDDNTRLILRVDGMDNDEMFEDDPEEEGQEGPAQPPARYADEEDEEDDAIERTRRHFNRQK